jgi:chemotaxis protein methyltransferase CheR
MQNARLSAAPVAFSIGDEEFALFQSLIQRESGIYLSAAKKALLVARLSRRLRELGLNCFRDYYDHAARSDSDELALMLDLICTNETSFFREPRHFEFLEQKIFPRWVAEGKRPRRAWSAACSTGEEPFSLAMILLEHFPASAGWNIEALGTDLSTRALRQAESATWMIEKAQGISRERLENFMLRGTRTQNGKMKASPALRSMVSFRRLNLNDSAYDLSGRFDLIFCRNALIYFEAATKMRVVNRLIDYLAPDGHLFLGHAESLIGLTTRVRNVTAGVYRLA